MSGTERQEQPPPGPSGALRVQCAKCGHVQDFDPENKICLNCGAPVDENDDVILEDPRRGRGMQGLAILGFVLFLFVFFFWSKYVGRHGMAVCALFAIWGFYRNYLHARAAREKHGHRGKP